MSSKVIKETPLMKQYREIKDKYPDSILLFRVGDFYETFHEDAIITSKILGIVLTNRGSGINKKPNWQAFRIILLTLIYINW